MKRTIFFLPMMLGIILTMKLGKVEYQGHVETYYNLPMHNITARADEIYGLSDVYGIREDGVKTYNGFVILATDWNKYPFGSVIETSLGTGIVLDAHETKREIVDIAVDW